VLLRPALPLAQWPRLTTWAAVCIARAVDRTTGCRTQIKWPNDLYLSGRKIAGILIETGTDVAQEPFAVLGIGVNVNHTHDDFPPELSGKADSLRKITGRTIDRAQLACAILEELNVAWRDLERDFPSIIAEAGRRSILLGEWVEVQIGSHRRARARRSA
jgi:BirA family biotin operon repressor/biotin-[acetyl-CoA-carboxylase] ligase